MKREAEKNKEVEKEGEKQRQRKSKRCYGFCKACHYKDLESYSNPVIALTTARAI